jgi:hypothetical protein
MISVLCFASLPCKASFGCILLKSRSGKSMKVTASVLSQLSFLLDPIDLQTRSEDELKEVCANNKFKPSVGHVPRARTRVIIREKDSPFSRNAHLTVRSPSRFPFSVSVPRPCRVFRLRRRYGRVRAGANVSHHEPLALPSREYSARFTHPQLMGPFRAERS